MSLNLKIFDILKSVFYSGRPVKVVEDMPKLSATEM